MLVKLLYIFSLFYIFRYIKQFVIQESKKEQADRGINVEADGWSDRLNDRTTKQSVSQLVS